MKTRLLPAILLTLFSCHALADTGRIDFRLFDGQEVQHSSIKVASFTPGIGEIKTGDRTYTITVRTVPYSDDFVIADFSFDVSADSGACSTEAERATAKCHTVARTLLENERETKFPFGKDNSPDTPFLGITWHQLPY